MAVYTQITKKDLSLLLDKYELGNLIKFQGILEGVENTNYQLSTTKGKYRVKKNEIPFFIELQNYLSNNNIKCPKPISDNNKDYINKIHNKSFVIMSFLNGKKINKVLPNHCYQLGKELANIHKTTANFKLNRKNNLDQSNWKNLFKKCKNSQNDNYKHFYNSIEEELDYLQSHWPKNLPKGIIHADLFQDNVFFINNILSGLIDFYFACYDYYSYELAICINAWCFKKNGVIDKEKYNSILEGYQSIRKIEIDEFKNLPILLRGAAMRFLITRLYDEIFHSQEAFVSPKDPLEYINILEFHQNNEFI